MDGLTTALREAAHKVPGSFLNGLPDFLAAKPPFQRSLICGLKEAWEAADREHAIETDWDHGWKNIVTFFEQLIGDAKFWQRAPATDHMRDWIASAVADFLQAGSKNDARAYEITLLPRTQALIGVLLEKARGPEQPSKDPVTQALNWPRGRAIEALFSQALRACRAGDRATGSHQVQWNEIMQLFEAELTKCEHANYEFSTFCGLYLAQLLYMDQKWTKAQIQNIFPSKFPLNSICALEGLAYAAFTRPVYSLLAEPDILSRALRYDLRGRIGREKLLERIGAAYLWGDEPLDSPRFSYIFEAGNIEDLQTMTRVFWMVRGQPISTEQKQLVIDYWDRCLAWSQRLSEPPAELFSSLSTLSCYLATADGKERELLEAVAPYVQVDRNVYGFVEELVRLVDVSPDGVSSVLARVIKSRVPDFDYKDQLMELLRALAAKGKKQDVISYAERLRNLPGMQELFDGLTRDS